MDFSARDDVLHDFLPFIRVYKDGRVERYILTEQVPSGEDLATGGQSKDVVISEELNIAARVFLPRMDTSMPNKKLPLVVHIHGGGFCTGSAFGPITRYSLNHFVSFANAIAITIDYRLAPEHPLPIAYDDCWLAMKWIASHAKGNGPDPWLNQYANFNNVYLTGESSGANLAHHVALEASIEPFEGVNIVGLSLIHPYFACSDCEDRIMHYIYPTCRTATGYNPMLNPGVDARLSKLVCKRVLVCVAEKDMMRNRGVAYYKALVKSGWAGIAEFLETEEEGHCFHLLNPTTPRAGPLLYKLASFVSDEC